MKGLTRVSKVHHTAKFILMLLACCVLLTMSFSVVLARPQGAQVVNGRVTFQQSGLNTNITASDRSIINYSSFDITRPEIVEFIQPSSSASVLNRILSASPTNIDGTLLANGRVFFVNPAGIYFGNGARVNVNQLVASSLNISDADFINGIYNFAGGNGSVINSGDISAEKVYLIGKQVANSGTISCPAGYVVMAAGERVFLSEQGSGILLEVEPPTLPEPADPVGLGTGVLNEGKVEAPGGQIVLAAAGDIYSQAISNVGSLSVSVETGQAGEVKLVAADGLIINSGSIDATSASGTGGTVQVLGDKVGLLDAAEIDVSGSEGGGTVLVGGDYQGKGETPTASRTYVGPDVTIKADATENGDGGKVIIWSDEVTGFYGDISARGGSESGDGGFVEVSGKNGLIYEGRSDLTAIQGSSGTLLLDPATVTINDTGTKDGELDDQQILSGDGLGEDWTISDDKVEAALDLADVLIQASTSITVDNPVDASGNTNTNDLTLGAPTINLKDPITLKAGASLQGEAGNATTNVSENGLIGNAIDVTAAGGTVNVADGTYTADLTVDKSNLTLRSVNGRGVTTIQLVDGVGIDIGSGGTGFKLGTDEDGNPENGIDNGFTILGGGATTFDIQLTNGPSGVEISWNTINTTGNATMGISVGAAGATGLNINNNIFTAGDIVDGSIWGPDMVNVSVSNNTFNGPAAKAASGYAVEFAGVTGTSSIQDNIISNYGMGIAIFHGTGTSGLTISGNEISYCTNGIRLGQYSPGVDGDMTTVTVTENTLSNNTIGLRIGNGANVKASKFTIQNNSFWGNETALANQHTSESITAIQNYWGAVDGPSWIGPGSGDPITEMAPGRVDYSPWWGGDYVGDPHDPDGWTWGTNDSIQDAIDLASATVIDTINIVAGSYAEVVTVDKNVNLSVVPSGTATMITLTSDALKTTGLSGNFAADGSGTDSFLFNGAVTLTGDTTLTSNDDKDITFDSTVDGAHDLAIDAGSGTTTFNEAVGGITPIGDGTGAALTINSSGTTSFEKTLQAASGITQANGAGAVTFKDAVTLAAGDDSGSTFNANVVLDGLTFESGSDITFGNAGTDTVTLSGAGVTINTTGAGDNLIVNSKVDGGQNLTLGVTGNITLTGAVGGSTALTSLSATGNTISAQGVRTTGSQSYTGAASFGGDLSAVGITFNNAVTANGTGGSANQTFDAGTGTLWAKSTINKSAPGNLTLGGDILVKLDGLVTVQNGDLTLTASAGEISASASPGINMVTDDKTLTLTQNDALDMDDFVVTNDEDTALIATSTAGSVTSTVADSWKSITATAKDNIELSGSGDISIASGGLVSHFGGVKVESTGGSISTPGAGGQLDAPITGTSDGTTGVDLPAGSGKAAIVIISKQQDLTIGENATLTANGTYYWQDETHDDRQSIVFLYLPPEGEKSGKPIDVAIYLGSYDFEAKTGGNVTVNSQVSMAANSTMVVDAYDTVDIGDNFTASEPWSDGKPNGLELVSRRTVTIDEAIIYNRLPYASEARGKRAPSWFTDALMGVDTYMLRGKEAVLAEVLASTGAVPIAAPVGVELEDRREMKEEDKDALRRDVEKELGEGNAQMSLARAYKPSLNTDMFPYKAAKELMGLKKTLKDKERMAAVVETITKSKDKEPKIEQIRIESGAAGQWLDDLAKYVRILNTDFGVAADESVNIAMQNYGRDLSPGGEQRVVEWVMEYVKPAGG